jgi:transcriptional regulator with XRE-family HTH domain
MNSENFGEWLKNELNEKGISQKELADLSGITPAQISRIISGTRGIGEQSIIAIAKALRIPVDLMFEKAYGIPSKSELSPKKRELMEKVKIADDSTVQLVIDMLDVAVRNKQRQVPNNINPKTTPR